MSACILNMEKVEYRKLSHGDKYEARVGPVGAAIGARKLGYNVTVLPPGKRAFPFHMHHANEEMFFILEGEGSVRIGEATHKIRQGDFICLPTGHEFAHQIINDSKAPLSYLAVSTMESIDVAEYPESGKIGVFTGAAPGSAPTPDSLRHFALKKDGIDYWEVE